MVNGTCVIQDNVYNCSVKKCEGIKEVFCAKDVFCVSGNCASSSPAKAGEQDSGKTMAYLSILTEAAKEVIEDNKNNPIDLKVKSAKEVIEQNEHKPVIFAGTKIECSKNILPGITKDCCADNEGIFSCADDEKRLIEAKRAGRAIEVGEYCHNKAPLTGVCTSYHTAYCVFGSRLARIIQNDGRKNQLGIGFGYVNDDDKGSNVDCRAITPYELSKMDFSKMNFGELYDAIKNEVEKRLPTNENLKQKVSEHTYQDLKEKTPQWKAASSKTTMEPNARDRIMEFYGK
jgi:conjugal transfer mating pair stabilization protein TraN